MLSEICFIFACFLFIGTLNWIKFKEKEQLLKKQLLTNSYTANDKLHSQQESPYIKYKHLNDINKLRETFSPVVYHNNDQQTIIPNLYLTNTDQKKYYSQGIPLSQATPKAEEKNDKSYYSVASNSSIKECISGNIIYAEKLANHLSKRKSVPIKRDSPDFYGIYKTNEKNEVNKSIIKNFDFFDDISNVTKAQLDRPNQDSYVNESPNKCFKSLVIENNRSLSKAKESKELVEPKEEIKPNTTTEKVKENSVIKTKKKSIADMMSEALTIEPKKDKNQDIMLSPINSVSRTLNFNQVSNNNENKDISNTEFKNFLQSNSKLSEIDKLDLLNTPPKGSTSVLCNSNNLKFDSFGKSQ